MTVTKKGLRSITVDGVELRWRFRLSPCGSPDCAQDPSHVIIVGDSREGEVAICYVPTGSGPVTPGRVAVTARAGMAAGWRPGEGAGERHVPLRDAPGQEDDDRVRSDA